MLKNCEECHRVFSHPSRNLCQECYAIAQKSFDAVRGYLRENPGATVAQVAKETEVSVDLIYEYISEGRLDVVPRDARLHCSICGTEIKIGKVCSKCRDDLRSTITSEPARPLKPKGHVREADRVHILDQIKKR
ncbi:MAG TPA: hypothetical protein VJZ70_05285 [Limnochordia bacterium]|nr:hypothetical protein [Limnochordia bacterium]